LYNVPDKKVKKVKKTKTKQNKTDFLNQILTKTDFINIEGKGQCKHSLPVTVPMTST
jgi:hypothetical protein